ncbi:MAG: hypothetical protein RIT81_01055 [Deltaproteobacteria bacterium]
MTLEQSIVHGTNAYRFWLDHVLGAGGVLVGRAVVAFEGVGLDVPLSVTTDRPDLVVKSGPDGVFGLVASSTRPVFGPVRVTVAAPGFASEVAVANLGTRPAPYDVGAVTMWRRPVRLTGRVVDAITGVPIAGATVRLVADPAPITAPTAFPVGLASTLPRDVAAGTTFTVRSYAPTGAVHRVYRRSRATDDRVWLRDRSGLAVGARLAVGVDRRRYFEVASLVGPPGANGQITLTAPVGVELDEGTLLHREAPLLGPPPVAAVATVAHPARRGDGVLFLTAPITSGSTAEIGGVVRAIAMRADAQGAFAFDGVRAGPVPIYVLAEAAGFAVGAFPWRGRMDEGVARVDVML